MPRKRSRNHPGRSDKELSKAAAEWPASRLVELWNSFAGVAPFADCKPAKKFGNRGKAVARIPPYSPSFTGGMRSWPNIVAYSKFISFT